MNLNGKKILFLAANFFGYEKAIIQRLQELGADVVFYNERPSDSTVTKGVIRVNKNFYFKKIKSYYTRILREIENRDYDFFLLIKGETIPVFFLEEFRSRYPKTIMIFYAYDAVSEYPESTRLYPHFNHNFTFEPKDALKYNLHFRPLFFIDEYTNIETKIPYKYDISFIGSAHTDRYIVGEQIQERCLKQNLKTFFYYYAPGRIAFILKKIFDKNLEIFDLKKLSFNKLSHDEISKVYLNSFSVLDINKPFQDGLTMRTFEALASGRKLLTTNPDIKNYPFFNSKNIQMLDRNNLEIDAEFFKNAFNQIDQESLEMMTLDSWIECLFVQNQDNYWKKFHPIFG